MKPLVSKEMFHTENTVLNTRNFLLKKNFFL